MIDRTASAPGKAVIAGEYAVLDGAPALSMALNRRARVQIAGIDDVVSRVTAPGYIDAWFRFRTDAEADIVWLDELPGTDALRLFETVWKQARISQADSWSITLDTTEFFDATGGCKLGLGSSAALATALAAALRGLTAHPDDDDSLAAAAHREFQHGAGSGVDIATATVGGLIQYQVGAPPRPLQWPAGLFYRLLWSGVAVSTMEKLQQFDKRSSGESRERLGAMSREVAEVWAEGRLGSLLPVLRDYVDALQRFSIDHGLGIFEAGHQELVARAKFHPNVVYKPCGAGGGDIGIVLAGAEKDVEQFTREASSAGFVPLEVELDPHGVRMEDSLSC